MVEIEPGDVALSLTADWLLRAVVATDPPDVVSVIGCLGTLVRAEPEAARAAARELGVDLEELMADGVPTAGSIGRDDVKEAARARARSVGRPVASVVDVTEAILAIALESTARVTEPVAPVATAPPVGPVRSEPDRDDRVVRVFISSTFRDMHEERDILVKRAFPELRRLCRARGVELVEVDLRWGITDEQAAEGQVLALCLEEIQRCRPYFIGLLGERYGWVPDQIGPEIIEREPWLAQHRGRSVTELEIIHGVLNDPDMAAHCFLYLRDPTFVESLPEDQRASYREGPNPEEVAAYGSDEAERRAAERRARLAALKDGLRHSGLRVRDYATPQGAGDLIVTDLTVVIDSLYPADSRPDPLEREAAEHEAFARSRAGVYIGRSAYFDALDTHAAGDGPPLVVLGESGAGKSALLTNWAHAHRDAHPEVPVVMHFIGSSPQSTDWAAMVRRVMGELARRLGIEGEIPDGTEELPAAFANWLHLAAARGRVVVILDALDRIEDREGGPDLAWLPRVIPPGVRLILSTLPGRPQAELSRRAWPALKVGPLEPGERRELVRRYLARYRKALSPARAERVANAEQAANPLFVRVLLEELRLWGEHESLDDRIDHYLTAPTVPDLYRLVLERWEADYGGARPGLVGEAMALLWAARRGLSEAELLDLLGSDGEPLPAAHWSPFFLAAEPSLGSGGGLIGFAHDYLRQAVQDAYVPTSQLQRAVHLRLADYFDPRREDPRAVEELPWQLAEASAWPRLHGLLADPDFLERAWESSEFDVKASWARVEDSSDLRLVDAYRPVVDAPAQHGSAFQHAVMTLLSHTGHDAQALIIGRSLIEHHRSRLEWRRLAETLGEVGYLLEDATQRTAAFREQAQIARSIGDPAQEASALIGQAAQLIEADRLEEAEDVLGRHRELARRSADRRQIHLGLGNRAVLHAKRREFAIAEELLREKETLARQAGDLAGVSSALHNRGGARADSGDPAGAIPLFEEAARINRALGDRATLISTLMNWAKACFLAGSRADAEAVLHEAMQIAEAAGAPVELEQAQRLLRSFQTAAVQAVVLTEGIDRAAREWMRAHTPDSSPSPDELMRLQTQHQALNRAALADPVDTDVLLELGIVCLALGKLDEAEHAFKGVLDHVGSYSGFEEVDSRSRQAARQHEPFDLPSAIRLPLCYLGFVYEGLGEHRLGERHVLAASFDCQDPSVLVLAGRFYLESSSPEPDTAIAYLKQAIELEPRYVATCDEMLDGFVETHRALYPVASWRLVESALEIWGTARDQALAGSSARPIDP